MAKILLVEDEAIIRMMLKDMLVGDGHQVIEASNGAEALMLLMPDVAIIISDIMMPRMRGEEWVARARSRPSMEAVPVIFMSALPPSPTAGELATFFLQKPFGAAALAAAVQRALAIRGGPPR